MDGCVTLEKHAPVARAARPAGRRISCIWAGHGAGPLAGRGSAGRRARSQRARPLEISRVVAAPGKAPLSSGRTAVASSGAVRLQIRRRRHRGRRRGEDAARAKRLRPRAGFQNVTPGSLDGPPTPSLATVVHTNGMEVTRSNGGNGELLAVPPFPPLLRVRLFRAGAVGCTDRRPIPYDLLLRLSRMRTGRLPAGGRVTRDGRLRAFVRAFARLTEVVRTRHF